MLDHNRFEKNYLFSIILKQSNIKIETFGFSIVFCFNMQKY